MSWDSTSIYILCNIIECEKDKSLLYMELEKRMIKRAEKQKQAAEEEQRRTDQEILIKQQMEVNEIGKLQWMFFCATSYIIISFKFIF